MPDAYSNSETEHGALGRRQHGALVRRHHEGGDCRARDVDQPRINYEKNYSHYVIGDDDWPGVEEMPMIEIDAIKPSHDADKAANQCGSG